MLTTSDESVTYVLKSKTKVRLFVCFFGRLLSTFSTGFVGKYKEKTALAVDWSFFRPLLTKDNNKKYSSTEKEVALRGKVLTRIPELDHDDVSMRQGIELVSWELWSMLVRVCM